MPPEDKDKNKNNNVAANGTENKFNITYKIKDAQWLSPYILTDDGSGKGTNHYKEYRWRPVDLNVWEQDIGLTVKTTGMKKGDEGKILVDLYYSEVDENTPNEKKTKVNGVNSKVYKYYKCFTGKIENNDAYLKIKITDDRYKIVKFFYKNEKRWDIHLYIKLFIGNQIDEAVAVGDFRGDNTKILRIEPFDHELYHYGKEAKIGTFPFYKYQFGFDSKGEQEYCLVRLNCRFHCNCKEHGQKGKTHIGVDFPVSPGTPVLAVAPGIVHDVEDSSKSGYGKYVIILHHAGEGLHNGLATRYAHNKEICVKKGDRVQKGDIIAKSGNTGGSTGPHLHYEVIKWGLNNKWKIELGEPIDPLYANFT